MEDKQRKSTWRDVIRGNVLMMGLVSLFTDMSSEMIYPLLPVFISGLVSVGSAAIYVGLMEGIAESVSSLLKIFSGRWSDALGKRKQLVVIGYWISTFSRPAMALSTMGWHVIALRFFDRIGKGIRTSPRDALISDSIGPEMRGRAFSFQRALDHLGAVIGSLSAILILYIFLGYGLWQGRTDSATPAEMSAMKKLFAISLIPGIFAMITLIAKVREIPPGKMDTTGLGVRETEFRPALPRRFFFFLTTVTIFALGNSSDLFLVFYGKTKFQLGLMQVILLWVALHMSKIAFSFLGGYIADRFGRGRSLIIGWAIYALVYLGIARVESQGIFWILILIYGVYYGMTEGAAGALVAEYTSSEHRGKAYGYYHGAIGLAALPASLVFGVFWAKLGPQIAFTIGASLAGLASILLFFLLLSNHAAGKTHST